MKDHMPNKEPIQIVCEVGRKTYVFLPQFPISKLHPFSVKGTSTFEIYC